MSESFGHYRIIEELGRGGMGVVYKAQEESLNRYVALKVLGAHLSEDESFVARFRREAQAAASLQHPNIVQIFYIGEDHDRHYFAMELVDGQSLREVIQARGALPVAEAVDIASQAAAGLAAAHDRGLLHRDVKPPNLMITTTGLVKLTDFGLALPSGEATRLTASGTFLGTPAYVSPEMCEGEQPDHRADIYALGITLYESLTGRVPFQSDSPMGLIREIVQANPPSVEHLNPDVPSDLAAVLDKMMAKEREDRYDSCYAVMEALEPFRDATRRQVAALSGVGPPAASGDDAPTVVAPTSEPARVSKTSIAITAVVALLGATAVAYWLRPPPQPEPAAMVEAPAAQPVIEPAPDKPAAAADTAAEADEPAPEKLENSDPVLAMNETHAGDQPAPTETPTAENEPPAEAVSEMPAETRPATTVARVEEPEYRAPPPKPLPERPRVAVISSGEPALSVAAEDWLEKYLASRGVEVVAEEGYPRVRDQLASGSSLTALLDALAAADIHVLVLADASYVSERELYYMGRYDVATTSRLQLSMILSDAQEPMWPGSSSEVEYTAVSASREAEEALRPVANDLTESLDSGWKRARIGR